MKILNDSESDYVRNKYIQCFVDSNDPYYCNYIQKVNQYRDGLCYTGYLWDCLKYKHIVSEQHCLDILSNQISLLVFWDIHSCERILLDDYWKYPKTAVLVMDYDEFIENRYTLPEDIYVTDESYSWSIVFTHEEDLQENRFCYYSYTQIQEI